MGDRQRKRMMPERAQRKRRGRRRQRQKNPSVTPPPPPLSQPHVTGRECAPAASVLRRARNEDRRAGRTVRKVRLAGQREGDTWLAIPGWAPVPDQTKKTTLPEPPISTSRWLFWCVFPAKLGSRGTGLSVVAGALLFFPSSFLPFPPLPGRRVPLGRLWLGSRTHSRRRGEHPEQRTLSRETNTYVVLCTKHLAQTPVLKCGAEPPRRANELGTSMLRGSAIEIPRVKGSWAACTMFC